MFFSVPYPRARHNNNNSNWSRDCDGVVIIDYPPSRVSDTLCLERDNNGPAQDCSDSEVSTSTLRLPVSCQNPFLKLFVWLLMHSIFYFWFTIYGFPFASNLICFGCKNIKTLKVYVLLLLAKLVLKGGMILIHWLLQRLKCQINFISSNKELPFSANGMPWTRLLGSILIKTSPLSSS